MIQNFIKILKMNIVQLPDNAQKTQLSGLAIVGFFEKRL